ncbi:outer membrane protein assembly factor BamD [bacterium]|nr:outer membrane protein assembly factor BamD [bacterium]
MKKIIAISLMISTSFVIASGCAKKEITIGRENPDEEIKKCIKLSEKKKYEEAVQCLEMFKSRFPKSPQGKEAELRIGDNYYKKKDHLLAADAYQAFVQLHPYHSKTDYAYYKMGMCYLKETPKSIDRDQGYLNDAVTSFQYLVINFPDSPYQELGKEKLSLAHTKIARRNYYIGRFYYRTDEYKAAIPRFEEVINNYSDTNVIHNSYYKIIFSYLKLSDLENAKKHYAEMLNNFPDHKLTKKAYKKILSQQKRIEKKN